MFYGELISGTPPTSEVAHRLDNHGPMVCPETEFEGLYAPGQAMSPQRPQAAGLPEDEAIDGV